MRDKCSGRQSSEGVMNSLIKTLAEEICVLKQVDSIFRQFVLPFVPPRIAY